MLSLPNCGIVRILSCKIEDTSGLVHIPLSKFPFHHVRIIVKHKCYGLRLKNNYIYIGIHIEE